MNPVQEFFCLDILKIKGNTDRVALKNNNMHWLTKFELRWGINSGLAFLTFLSVIKPVAALGVLIIALGYLFWLATTFFKDYVHHFREVANPQQAGLFALSDNAADLLFFLCFVGIGFCLAVV